MKLVSGTVIDRYELVEVLGRGGFATVWLVRHTVLGSEHALKVLDPRWVEDEELRARFLAEGRIQATLEHPNIVRVTDIVVTEGVAGLVMGRVRGAPLDELLQRRSAPLAPGDAAELMLPVLDACGFAHERGIVHRDLKPANVLVEERRGKRVPMVLDFGIAKLMEHAEVKGRGRTRTGVMMGSIDYMSPEQVSGAGSVDSRTDIFALGVMLAQLLTRSLPFGEGSQFEVMTRIVEGRTASGLAERLEGTPLGQVALRAMACRPDDRFDSCDEMAEAVRDAVKGQAPKRRSPAVTWASEDDEDPISSAPSTPARKVVALAPTEPEILPAEPEMREEILRITNTAPTVPAPEVTPGGWWSFRGRASRTQFWRGHLLYGVFGLVWVVFLDVSILPRYRSLDELFMMWAIWTPLFGAMPLAGRRLQDAGFPGWWSVLMFMGLVALGVAPVVFFLLGIGLINPSQGVNKYGRAPT